MRRFVIFLNIATETNDLKIKNRSNNNYKTDKQLRELNKTDL